MKVGLWVRSLMIKRDKPIGAWMNIVERTVWINSPVRSPPIIHIDALYGSRHPIGPLNACFWKHRSGLNTDDGVNPCRYPRIEITCRASAPNTPSVLIVDCKANIHNIKKNLNWRRGEEGKTKRTLPAPRRCAAKYRIRSSPLRSQR